jgi:hypothetical protein
MGILYKGMGGLFNAHCFAAVFKIDDNVYHGDINNR